MYDYMKSLERSRRSRSGTTAPKRFELVEREWIVLPGVFSPADTASTEAHLGLLEFPVGGTFLEVGCGTGVIAVMAALSGCSRVTALDVNESAVENTRLNAELHGVEPALGVLCSDMFDSLSVDCRFDVVYWHSNNAWVPETLSVDLHELAYVDPGYAAHEKFFSGVGRHIAPGGRILIGVSSRAELSALEELAMKNDLELRSLVTAVVSEPEGPVIYELLEAVPAASDEFGDEEIR